MQLYLHHRIIAGAWVSAGAVGAAGIAKVLFVVFWSLSITLLLVDRASSCLSHVELSWPERG